MEQPPLFKTWSISSETADVGGDWETLMAELPDLTEQERAAIERARAALGTDQQDLVDEETLQVVFGVISRHAAMKRPPR